MDDEFEALGAMYQGKIGLTALDVAPAVPRCFRSNFRPLGYGPSAVATSKREMQSVNTALQRGRRSTQRARLLAGIVAVANRDGYAGASVSAVIAEAGVSRPTFYDYFTGREDCYLAALADAQEAMTEAVRQAIDEETGGRPARAAVAGLVEFAQREPVRAGVVMSDVLSAGPAALDVRDRGVQEIAAAVEQAERSLPDETPAPDLPLVALIGGAQRLLGAQLRRGTCARTALSREVIDWVGSYERPRGEQRWRMLKPLEETGGSGGIKMSLRAPGPLGPGRPQLSSGEVAENHRQRLLFAAAELAGSLGYAETTIAAVTQAAGLDRRAFYAIFADKRELFMAAHEFGSQRLLAVTAGAFFGGTTWPLRVYEGMRGLSEFLEANPPIAHVGFVDAYSVGPAAVQRTEDSVSAFSVFLQEGYRYAGKASDPSELALEAIIWTAFEIIYWQVRAQAKLRLASVTAHMSLIALAPFLGSAAAEKTIERARRELIGRGRAEQA